MASVYPEDLPRNISNLNFIDTSLIVIEKILVTHLNRKSKYHHSLSLKKWRDAKHLALLTYASALDTFS